MRRGVRFSLHTAKRRYSQQPGRWYGTEFCRPGDTDTPLCTQAGGSSRDVEPIDPAWIDDALTAALRVFEAHRVHFADAYFAYRARETSHETVGRSAAAGIGAMQPAGDLLDDTPLLADTFAIAQLAALVSLEATGLTDIIDVRLVVERLRDNAPAAPDPGPGDITLSPDLLSVARSPGGPR